MLLHISSESGEGFRYHHELDSRNLGSECIDERETFKISTSLCKTLWESGNHAQGIQI